MARIRVASSVLCLVLTVPGVVATAAASDPATLGVAAGGPQLPVPEQNPDVVRRTVDRVLDRKEYRRPSPGPLERARAWVRRQIARFFATLVGGGRGQLLAWVVVAAGLGVIGILLARLGRGLTVDPARSIAVAESVGRSPAEWRAEAQAHEQAGRWRLGLRCRYRALVADLAERGLVDEVPGRTAGEYRREVGESAPQLAPDFAGATELFEQAWYGNRPTGEDDSARFRQLEDRVLTGARG